MAVGELGLELLIRDGLALLQIDQQHLARLQAPLAGDILFGNVEHAHFGGQQDKPVLGLQIARRAQTVSIQRRTHHLAVRKSDGGRTIPGFHQGGVVLVERAEGLIHQRIAGPGFRDQHHHRVGQRVAALVEQLERVIKTCRIRLPIKGDWPQLLHVVAKHRRGHGRLTGRHPVVVAAQRVDFAIVANHPIRMGQGPGRERVGGEPLMHQRHGGDDPLVLQILEIGDHAVGEHQPLIDDGPGRDRHRVIANRGLRVLTTQIVGRHLAGHK